MLRRFTRQLTAGCGALLAALVFAAPAAAAPRPADGPVAVGMRDVTVADGHPGVVAGVTLASAEPMVLDDVVVTYDFKALAGLVEVVAPAGTSCSLVDTTILTCTRDRVRLGSAPLAGQFDVVIRAIEGAKVDGGPLQFGVRAAGLALVSGVSLVRVGAAVDLVAGPETELTRRPGESFTLPLKVDVAGLTAVEHPSVYFTDAYAFRATRKFSNCYYIDDRVRNCSFEGTLEPGESYGGMLPFVLGADTAAPGTKTVEATWLTAAEAADYEALVSRSGYSGGEPGTEGELTLTGEALRLAGDQADTVPSNNRSTVSVTVTGDNAADLAAVGAAVRGAVGERRSVSVGVRNLGPAAAERPGDEVASVDVTIPPGTTALAVSPECAPLADALAVGTGGAAAYRCRPGSLVRPDLAVEFVFELRIDRARPADGAVRLTGAGDHDTTNDQAAITVNRQTPAPPAANSGLAITGAPAGTLAALGALLVLCGMAAVLLTRPRAG